MLIDPKWADSLKEMLLGGEVSNAPKHLKRGNRGWVLLNSGCPGGHLYYAQKQRGTGKVIYAVSDRSGYDLSDPASAEDGLLLLDQTRPVIVDLKGFWVPLTRGGEGSFVTGESLDCAKWLVPLLDQMDVQFSIESRLQVILNALFPVMAASQGSHAQEVVGAFSHLLSLHARLDGGEHEVVRDGFLQAGIDCLDDSLDGAAKSLERSGVGARMAQRMGVDSWDVLLEGSQRDAVHRQSQNG